MSFFWSFLGFLSSFFGFWGFFRFLSGFFWFLSFLNFFVFRVHPRVKTEIQTRLCAGSNRGYKNKPESAPVRSKTHDDPKPELKLPYLLGTEEHKKTQKNTLFSVVNIE
jgi:hypothetical protein